MGSSGSNSPAFTSPALAITIAGAPPRSRNARSSASRSSRPTPSRASFFTFERPMPSIASAFTSLACTKPDPRTGTAGSPPMPASSTSTSCRMPHHRRAHARAVKLAIVAPVVSTPPQLAGMPNRSFNHSRATTSIWPPIGDSTQAAGFWSSVVAVQSAPTAPPASCRRSRNGRTSGRRCGWRRRGPPSSSPTAASAPTPSSGNGPPKVAATSSAFGHPHGTIVHAGRGRRTCGVLDEVDDGVGLIRRRRGRRGHAAMVPTAGGPSAVRSRAGTRASRSSGASRARACLGPRRSPPSPGRGRSTRAAAPGVRRSSCCCACEPVDLAAVQQQLARTHRQVAARVPLLVRRDVHALEPDLAVADPGVRLAERRPATSQRLHLVAGEHDAALERLWMICSRDAPCGWRRRSSRPRGRLLASHRRAASDVEEAAHADRARDDRDQSGRESRIHGATASTSEFLISGKNCTSVRAAGR